VEIDCEVRLVRENAAIHFPPYSSAPWMNSSLWNIALLLGALDIVIHLFGRGQDSSIST
jgi:hypothetical protein